MKSPFLMAIAENMSMKNYAEKQTRSPIEFMSSSFLARQGLISLKDLWINIHYSS